jgi:hypothetical protein
LMPRCASASEMCHYAASALRSRLSIG